MKLSFSQSFISTRVMYLFVIIAYPVTGYLLSDILQPNFDPIGWRLVASAILSVVFVGTFTSWFVRRYISNITIVLFFLLTIHTGILVYFNDYDPAYVMGLIITVMAATLIIRSLRSMLFFFMIFIPLILDLLSRNPEELQTPPSILLTILFTALLTTLVVILVFKEYLSKISLSHKVIESGMAWIMVYDFGRNKVLSNMDHKTRGIELRSWERMERQLRDMKNQSVEIQIQDLNQKTIWLKWSSSYYKNYRILIGHDITNLKTKEQELEEFAYVVSHDLKSPLRNISSLSSFIREDFEDNIPKECNDLLGQINEQVFRMESLIRGILDYSRTSNMPTKLECVDLNEVLSDVLMSIKIPDQFDLSVDNLPSLKGDRMKMHQIFQNLIDNAISHNTSEHPSLQIKTSENDELVTLSFIDNGPGIDSKFKNKIFELFRTASTEQGKSTGVGLTTVKKCTSQLGGVITVDSDYGQGAVFKLSFPKKLIVSNLIAQ